MRLIDSSVLLKAEICLVRVLLLLNGSEFLYESSIHFTPSLLKLHGHKKEQINRSLI